MSNLVTKYEAFGIITCFECGGELNSHTTDNPDTPKDGDLSICGHCAAVGQYVVKNGHVTDIIEFEDWDELDSDEVAHLKKMQSERRKNLEKFTKRLNAL